MKRLLSTIETKEQIRKENEKRNQKLLPKFGELILKMPKRNI